MHTAAGVLFIRFMLVLKKNFIGSYAGDLGHSLFRNKEVKMTV